MTNNSTNNEPEFTRTKSLSKDFDRRLLFNANDLYRLGQMASKLVDNYDGRCRFVIESRDKKQLIRTSDPTFFISHEMISGPRRIAIYYWGPISSADCEVHLYSYMATGASLKVNGENNVLVHSILGEFEFELLARAGSGTRLLKFVNSMLGRFLMGVVSVFAAISVIRLIVDIFAIGLSFEQLDAFSAIIVTMILVTLSVVFYIGMGFLPDVILSAYPFVEFTGELAPIDGYKRQTVLFWFLVVIIPIVINVISNLISATWFGS